MLVYRSENPHALKGKNKDHLPVYWTANKTAWVTRTNFSQWLKESFIPEVKEFLAAKNLAFKVLLLMDNCKSHVIDNIHPDVELQFLPPNTTSLIQPMDQTVIATFKSYYLRRVMNQMIKKINHHQQCEEFNRTNVVKSFWKSFTIMDAITIVQESWDEVSHLTLNRSWRKLWPEVVPEKTQKTPGYEETLPKIVNLAHEIGGEGFQDLEGPEVMELLLPSTNSLTSEELEELAVPLPNEENAPAPVTPFGGSTILKIINALQSAIELAIENDPIMVRSLKFKHSCDKAAEVYEELYKDVLRRARQCKMTDFFKTSQ